MVSLILFSLLFFLPFVVLPFGASHYETPKVIVAEILIILLVMIVALSSDKTLPAKRKNIATSIKILPSALRKKKIVTHLFTNNFLLFLLFCLSTLTLLFHNSPVAFLGNTFRWQGTFLLWLLLGFSFAVGVFKLRIQKPAVYVTLLVIQLYFALSGSINPEGRSVGTLGEPNALAASAIFLWPWVLESVRTQKGKRTTLSKGLLLCVSIVVGAFIVVLSGSRSGMLAFGVQLVVLFLRNVLSLKKTAVVAAALFVISLLLPFTDTQTVYEKRADVWKTAFIAGYEYPIVGWGFGNVEIALKAYNKKLYNNLQGYYVDSSHNFFLDIWVSGGLLGLSIVVLLLFHTHKKIITTGDTQRMMLFWGLITVMSFNPMSVVTLVQFWWLIGHAIHEI